MNLNMGFGLLTGDHFELDNATNSLRLNLNGSAIVMFSAPHCPHCTKFTPTFQQLSNEFSDIKFAQIDLGQHAQVVNLSNHTSNPITKVPQFYMYINGHKFSEYTGPLDRDNFRQFLMSVQQRMPQNTPVQTMPVQRAHDHSAHHAPQQPVARAQPEPPMAPFGAHAQQPNHKSGQVAGDPPPPLGSHTPKTPGKNGLLRMGEAYSN